MTSLHCIARCPSCPVPLSASFLADCPILWPGAADAEKFAGALATNTTLQEFYASGKSIGVDGARAFGTCLPFPLPAHVLIGVSSWCVFVVFFVCV